MSEWYPVEKKCIQKNKDVLDVYVYSNDNGAVYAEIKIKDVLEVINAPEEQREGEKNVVGCKACKAHIVYLVTKLGKQMPVNAETVKPGDTEFDFDRHVSHFATCPAASRFRAPKKKEQHLEVES